MMPQLRSRRFNHIFSLVLLIGLVGCRGQVAKEQTVRDSDEQEGAPSQLAPLESPIEIVDRLERKVSLAKVPQRLISLSPATTELLFAIGAGPSIVGATKHCNYPEEALAIARIGSGTMEGISRETILSLHPDLVLGKADTHKPLIETLERLGIPIVTLGPETLDELFAEAKLLGRITGHEKEAAALIDRLTRRRDALMARVAGIEPSQQRTVFYEVWDDPLMTAGPKSFIGEMLDMGRMKNLFPDTDVRYPRISSEVVVDRNPDVILAPTTHMKLVEFSRIASRPGWSNIRAVSEKQFFLIDGDQVSRCGPRLLDALEQMIDSVYPETKVSSETKIREVGP